MKYKTIKTAAMACLALGLVSCADELNIKSIDKKYSTTYTVEELLAKQYGSLGLTGQKGATGDGDVTDKEDESGYYRTVFNLQELNSDEILWAWLENTDMSPICYFGWNKNSERANWCYQRLAYNITLYNQFISEQDGKIDADQIAEIRFLRAMMYFNFLDLFHKAPFKDTFNAELPVEKGGKELYDWIDKELTEIEPIMKEVGAYNNRQNFGRADRGAAYALHARLALNSEVYTDGQVADYAKAKSYCDKILTAKVYKLSKATNANGYSGYQQLFMADNDENEQAIKETIFPIRQDGAKTREDSGSTMLINGSRMAGMPYYYQSNPWQCIFARKTLLQKFITKEADIPVACAADAAPGKDAAETLSNRQKVYDKYIAANNLDKSNLSEANVVAMDKALGGSTAEFIKKADDQRALFYCGVGGGLRTIEPAEQVTGFTNGASIVKWSSVRSDKGTVHDINYCDTDIPLIRLAEIYLTRAEAMWRLNEGDKGLADLQEVQGRAGKTTLAPYVNAQILIDEWCKEFYMEGRRRSDLIRFGLYTGSKYLWSFKGGAKYGRGVDGHYAIYPIPAGEISGNPNMTQNPGY